jgi:hypothetical protein
VRGGAEWYSTARVSLERRHQPTPRRPRPLGHERACNDYGSIPTQDSLTSTSLNVSNCNSNKIILKFNYLLSYENDNTNRTCVKMVADSNAPM